MIVLVAALMLVQGSASASAFPAAPATPAAQRNMSEIPPEAARLIDQVMSPFCPGLILTNCPTMQADSLRKAIRGRIQQNLRSCADPPSAPAVAQVRSRKAAPAVYSSALAGGFKPETR